MLVQMNRSLSRSLPNIDWSKSTNASIKSQSPSLAKQTSKNISTFPTAKRLIKVKVKVKVKVKA